MVRYYCWIYEELFRFKRQRSIEVRTEQSEILGRQRGQERGRKKEGRGKKKRKKYTDLVTTTPFFVMMFLV
jgi:hypothetical protein